MTNDIIIIIKLWAQNHVHQLFPECTETYLRAFESSKISPGVIPPGTPTIVLRGGRRRYYGRETEEERGVEMGRGRQMEWTPR